MGLSNQNTDAISFKKLSGKAHTDQNFSVSEEGISTNVQLSYTTIFAQPIEPLPITNSGYTGLYSGNGIIQRVKFQIDIIPNTQLAVGQSQGYRLKLPSDWNSFGDLYPEFSAGTYLHSALGRLQIVPALYGKLKGDGSTEYDPKLYQTDGVTQITKFDAINWYFDPYDGVLFVEDPKSNYDTSPTRPGFLEAFLYVGKYINDALAHISGGTGSTGGGTLTGATNGLHVLGKNVVLGGAVTNATVVGDINNGGILFDKNKIYSNDSNAVVIFDGNPTGQSYSTMAVESNYATLSVFKNNGTTGFSSNVILNGDDSLIQSIIGTEFDRSTTNYTQANYEALSVSGGSSYSAIFASNFSGITNSAVSLMLSTSISGITPTFGAIIGVYNSKILTPSPNNTHFAGLQYDHDYSPYFTKRSLPDIDWVTGHTSGTVLGGINGLTKVGSNLRLGGSMTGSSVLDATAGGTNFNDVYVVAINGSASATNLYPASAGHYYLGGEILAIAQGNNRTAIVAYPQNNATGILATNATAAGYTGNLGVYVMGNNGAAMTENLSQPLVIIKKYYGNRGIYNHTGAFLEFDLDGATGTGITSGSYIRMNRNGVSQFEITPAGEFKISGSTGLAGQVIKSGGAGNEIYWGNESGSTAIALNNFVFGTGTGIAAHASQFTANENVLVIMTQTPPVISGGSGSINNVFVFGEAMRLNGAPTGGGTITDSGMFGYGHIIGDNVGFFSGAGTLSYGGFNDNFSLDGLVGGAGARSLSNGSGSVAIALDGNPSIGGSTRDNPSYQWVIANGNAVNISKNSTGQTAGHGALAPLSVILGGQDHNIPTGSSRSVVLGGNRINVASGVTDTVHLPKVRIGLGIGAGLVTNNTNADILVRNSATGEIEIRDAATLIGTGNTGSSQNIYVAKKIVTGSTTLLTTDFVVFVNGTAPLTLTLPLSPNDGEVFKIKDVSGSASTKNITINGNGHNIDGSSTILINSDRGGVELCFDTTLNAWFVMNFVG